MDCALPAQKEKILATRASEARSTENKARAEASFKKEERAKEGAKAPQQPRCRRLNPLKKHAALLSVSAGGVGALGLRPKCLESDTAIVHI